MIQLQRKEKTFVCLFVLQGPGKRKTSRGFSDQARGMTIRPNSEEKKNENQPSTTIEPPSPLPAFASFFCVTPPLPSL